MNCTHMSTTRQGSTPLHQSALSGNYTMTQMLLGAGANIHAMDKQGKTPLDVAKQRTQMSLSSYWCGGRDIIALLEQASETLTKSAAQLPVRRDWDH